MHNVRLIKYDTGFQVRVYNRVYGAPFPDDSKREEEELEFNPFTGVEEKIRTFEDIERSKTVSRSRTIDRLYYLTRSNDWDWFVTLTFNPDKVDSLDYSACTKKLSKWLNHCKEKSPNMKYIVVPEKHESGRFHFHGMFADCEEIEFVDSGRTTNGGETIYNIGSYRLGFTTATKVKDAVKVAKYVTKYITKDLCAVTFGKRRYWASRNICKAEIEELVIEGTDKKAFLESFADNVTYAKTVNSPIVKTDYYELDSVSL